MKKRASFGIAAAALLSTASAAAEPVRILVAAGNKQGLAAEQPLKYADADAKRVRDVLVDMGGVKKENAFVLAAPTKDQLFAAIDKAKAEAQKHKASEVTLIFYFSGHGDRDAIHLADERVLSSDLVTKLGEVPASLRIAVTDACRTTRDKGFVADEPFAISATATTQATGQVWLHASSDGEAAQESDELQGAIFTHAWLNGLRGAADSNGDSRVTLDESFAFAHSQTLIRSEKSSGVLQKPEAVVNLHELAPLVLTQTGQKAATLSLPQAKDTHFLVYAAGSKSVLSELWGSGDRRLALSVPPGKYVIMRRSGSSGALATITVAQAEERKVEEGDFSTTQLDAVAKKGDDPDVVALPEAPQRHHEIAAGWELGADARTGLVQGPRVAYTYALRSVGFTLGAGADFSARDVDGADEHLAATFGRAGIDWRIGFGRTTLRLGGGGRAGWLIQSLDQKSKSTTNGAFIFGPELYASARTTLTPATFFDLGVTGNLLVVREESSARVVPGVTGGAALGLRF